MRKTPEVSYAKVTPFLSFVLQNMTSFNQSILAPNATEGIQHLKELYNTIIYDGSENDLVIMKSGTVEFICNFEMIMYPFDVQRCSVLVQLTVDEALSVDLLPGNLTSTASNVLSYYYVTNISYEEYLIQNNVSYIRYYELCMH